MRVLRTQWSNLGARWTTVVHRLDSDEADRRVAAHRVSFEDVVDDHARAACADGGHAQTGGVGRDEWRADGPWWDLEAARSSAKAAWRSGVSAAIESLMSPPTVSTTYTRDRPALAAGDVERLAVGGGLAGGEFGGEPHGAPVGVGIGLQDRDATPTLDDVVHTAEVERGSGVVEGDLVLGDEPRRVMGDQPLADGGWRCAPRQRMRFWLVAAAAVMEDGSDPRRHRASDGGARSAMDTIEDQESTRHAESISNDEIIRSKRTAGKPGVAVNIEHRSSTCGKGAPSGTRTPRQLRKPIFAAVNGIAYGGGCELAQSTDFIIASQTATFGQPEAMLGLAAGGGSPALLPRVLPRGKALQMLMTGDPVPAQEAHRLGMVNELHAPGDLMPAARRIADTIASNSPTAVQSVKRAVQLGEGQPIEQAIAIMMDAHWRSAVHPDRVEGIGAFNDGRDPTFDDADF